MNADIAWAAGLFDGEGCITFVGNPRTPRLRYNVRINVVVTHRLMIEKVAAVLGGHPRPKRLRRPYPNRRDQWVWQLTGIAAVNALRQMRPHLIGKAEEADLAIEFHWRRKIS